MAFGGGKSWKISPDDFNVGQLEPVSLNQCLGALFDLSGSNITPDPGNPVWVVGDTFLVCNLHPSFSVLLQII
jgi:cathepsin D